jgi:hypothetical protein
MVHVDHIEVTMALRRMPVRVPMRLRALPAFVLMPMMFIVHMQVRVLDWRMLMLEHLRVLAWPQTGTRNRG